MYISRAMWKGFKIHLKQNIYTVQPEESVQADLE